MGRLHLQQQSQGQQQALPHPRGIQAKGRMQGSELRYYWHVPSLGQEQREGSVFFKGSLPLKAGQVQAVPTPDFLLLFHVF